MSYAAQESWCTSDSVRDNILFGEPFEESRYWKVVSACGLEPDLKLFDDGDLTEVGEKGITLSGGQKARLTLARAIYSKTAIVLLDGESFISQGYEAHRLWQTFSLHWTHLLPGGSLIIF